MLEVALVAMNLTGKTCLKVGVLKNIGTNVE